MYTYTAPASIHLPAVDSRLTVSASKMWPAFNRLKKIHKFIEAMHSSVLKGNLNQNQKVE